MRANMIRLAYVSLEPHGHFVEIEEDLIINESFQDDMKPSRTGVGRMDLSSGW